MDVVVIDYGSGNLRSAAKALERVSRENRIGARIIVSERSALLDQADRIVLPGVGAFGDCIAGLRALPGMVEALENNVRQRGKAFLGICVGMQLMADRGIEHGLHPGLGWIPGEVRPLSPSGQGFKIPHMGWNELEVTAENRRHPVLADLPEGAHAYFVHSFGMNCETSEDILATTDHGGRIPAIVGRENMVGTQFHPEKSQETGLRFLTNFLNWDGAV